MSTSALPPLPSGYALESPSLPPLPSGYALEPGSATPSPTDALSKTTGISAGPGFLERKWNEIKAGLTSAQEGGGLAPQPTTLGNAAQFAGVLGTELSQLGSGSGDVASASENIADTASKAIPSAQRAGQTFQELKGALGNHTVAVTDRLADALGEIKGAVDTGSTLPTAINKFVTRIADVDEGPLTYNDARQLYSNISDLSASERMAARPKDLRLIQEFKHALGDSISQTADSAGKLQDYQNAMSEFAKSKRIENAVDKAKKAIIPAVVGASAYESYSRLKDLIGH